MAKSSQERQAERRERLKGGGYHRTTVLLSAKAYQALRQLKTLHGTQSGAVEACILAAEVGDHG